MLLVNFIYFPVCTVGQHDDNKLLAAHLLNVVANLQQCHIQ